MDDLLELTDEGRGALEAVMHSNVTSKELQRAQALLLLDEREPVANIADWLRVSRQTIYNWVERFQQQRSRTVAASLRDAPREGCLNGPRSGSAISGRTLPAR